LQRQLQKRTDVLEYQKSIIALKFLFILFEKVYQLIDEQEPLFEIAPQNIFDSYDNFNENIQKAVKFVEKYKEKNMKQF
jgi:hypothetical protein